MTESELNRPHTTSRDEILNWCVLAIIALVCVGCSADSPVEDSTADDEVVSTTNAATDSSTLPETTQTDDVEIEINGATFRQVDPSSIIVSDDEPVAGGGPGAEPTAMPVYIPPWFNYRGPQIQVGPFSDELRDATSESALDLADTMKEEWATLPYETMFVMAIRLYDLGHKDEAVYWFYSAQFRARVLIAIMEPESIGGIGSLGFELKQAFAAFMQLSGTYINTYAFEHPDMLRSTLKTVMDEREPIPEFPTIYPGVELIEPDQWAQQTEDVAENMQKLIDFVDENADFIREHGRPPRASGTFTQPADRQLADAASVGDIDGIDAALANGADVNARGSGGQTPLEFVYRAVRYEGGSKEGFEYLLQQGADPNILGDRGTALIHQAAQYDTDLLRLCLDYGGDPNLRDAVEGLVSDQFIGQTPIYEAILSESLENMELLLEHGADINVKNTIREASPLYSALRFHKPIAAKWLLEHGADWTAQTSDGTGIPEVALHYEFDAQQEPERAAAQEWILNFLEEQGVDLEAAEQRSREIFGQNFHRIDR